MVDDDDVGLTSSSCRWCVDWFKVKFKFKFAVNRDTNDVYMYDCCGISIRKTISTID